MIKKAMKKKGWNVPQLHKHVDVSIQHLYHVVSGRSDLTPTMAKKLAKALDLDANELFLFYARKKISGQH